MRAQVDGEIAGLQSSIEAHDAKIAELKFERDAWLRSGTRRRRSARSWPDRGRVR